MANFKLMEWPKIQERKFLKWFLPLIAYFSANVFVVAVVRRTTIRHLNCTYLFHIVWDVSMAHTSVDMASGSAARKWMQLFKNLRLKLYMPFLF